MSSKNEPTGSMTLRAPEWNFIEFSGWKRVVFLVGGGAFAFGVTFYLNARSAGPSAMLPSLAACLGVAVWFLLLALACLFGKHMNRLRRTEIEISKLGVSGLYHGAKFNLSYSELRGYQIADAWHEVGELIPALYLFFPDEVPEDGPFFGHDYAIFGMSSETKSEPLSEFLSEGLPCLDEVENQAPPEELN